MREENMTTADLKARVADVLKSSPYPWRNLALEELPRNDYWSDFGGFERWLKSQDDLLDSAYPKLSIDEKAALYLAFTGACEFAYREGKANNA